MINFFNQQIQHFLWEAAIEDSPQPVNLEQDFEVYSFLRHHPEDHKAIDQLFRQTVGQKKGTVASLVKSLEFHVEDLKELEKVGFTQLSQDPETGIILEHKKGFKGWLVKKNYSYRLDGKKLKRIIKAVTASDFPAWMLPSSLRKFAKEGIIGVQVPNDVLNPLRVIILKRARKLIKELGLDCVKAAKEYLYLLPDESLDISTPFHERVVVISKKVDILDEVENIKRYIEMAYHRQEQLHKVVQQISVIGKQIPITDLHLHNLRFLNDKTDTVMFIDGEPIGGLSDVSEPLLVNGMKMYDRGFFSLLGLKKLQQSLHDQMEDEEIDEEDIQQVFNIFKQVIDPLIDEIISERRWHVLKVILCRNNHLIAYVIEIFSMLRVFYYSYSTTSHRFEYEQQD